MLELLLCSAVTILPDFLYRRFVQGKRIGREITLFSVWYELRWGITFCVILTVLLITTIFYFHPSTSSAVSVFRTVTILPETNGRVAETYVNINQRVAQGQPLFRLDSTEHEAAIETAKRRIAEVDATVQVATAQLAEADGQIAHARGALQQALDEFGVRAELRQRNPDAIPQRDVDRAQVLVDTQQGLVDAALAGKAALQTEIDFQLPAQKASAEAALREAEVALEKTLVVAGTDGIVQQFALRAGDVVNPMLRPAGILVPDRHATGLVAGFGQIEAQVIRVGMVGEVACVGDALHGGPDGDHRRAGRDRLGPDPPDRPAPGRRGLRRPRHDHRDHGAALRGRPRPPAAGQRLHRQRLHLQPRRAPGPGDRRLPRLRPARDRRDRPRPRRDPPDAGADPAGQDAGPVGRPLM